MNPDLAITIGFCFEVLVVAVVLAFYVAHEVHKAHANVERAPDRRSGERRIR
jgi:hypothetical protein